MSSVVNGDEDRVEGGATLTGGGRGSGNNTPHNTDRNRSASVYPNTFGCHTTVKTSGKFPNLGSKLGQYFCVGRLGAGTFCSIHKCINLNYYSECNKDGGEGNGGGQRLAAAKVGKFQHRLLWILYFPFREPNTRCVCRNRRIQKLWCARR